MLLLSDRNFPYAVSVANFPFNLLMPNTRSARYRLVIGRIADLTPRCVVTLRVH